MKRILTFLVPAIVILCLSSSGYGQPVLTVDMVLNARMVTGSAISPDGRVAAYTLRVPRDDAEAPGGAYTELHLIPAAGGNPKPLVTKPHSVSSVSFSRDGRFISFIATRKDTDPNAQVYRVSADGGDVQPLTRFERSVLAYRWSPDGRKIAFTTTDGTSEEQKEAEKKGMDWTVVDAKPRYTRLYTVDVGSSSATLLTRDDMNIWDFEWMPDGEGLVVQASDLPTTDASYMFKKIFLCDLKGHMRPYCRTQGKLGHMSFSPDGKTLAFMGGTSLNDPAAGTIFVSSGDAAPAVDLLPGYEGTVQSFQWIDARTILYVSNVYSSVVVQKLDVLEKKHTDVIRNDRIFGSLALADDYEAFVCTANHARHPGEVYAGSLRDGSMRRLTNHNPTFESLQLGKQESIRWKATDGLEIEGVLIYPRRYQEGKRYPLVVSIHGGPESNYQNGWTSIYFMWGQLLAARGYAVLLPNYRASTGRGATFAKMDHRDLGGKEFLDVIDGIAHLAGRGLVDPKRVGIGGFSYGGYFAGLGATKYSERFAAAVMGAGITNWISYMGTADIPQENTLVHWDLSCYDQPELCFERSPISHVNQARTPLLIVHGGNDARVPVSQGYELYQAFRTMRIPVEMVVYPREGHGIAEKAHLRDFLNRTLDWFDKYVVLVR